MIYDGGPLIVFALGPEGVSVRPCSEHPPTQKRKKNSLSNVPTFIVKRILWVTFALEKQGWGQNCQNQKASHDVKYAVFQIRKWWTPAVTITLNAADSTSWLPQEYKSALCGIFIDLAFILSIEVSFWHVLSKSHFNSKFNVSPRAFKKDLQVFQETFALISKTGRYHFDPQFKHTD